MAQSGLDRRSFARIVCQQGCKQLDGTFTLFRKHHLELVLTGKIIISMDELLGL